MRPNLTLLGRLWPRLLALAIALVVGMQVGPRPAHESASTPVVCSIDQTALEDAPKVGERLEPRVAPAPLVDRLPTVPPSARLHPVTTEVACLRPLIMDLDRRLDGDPLPIVKHVPRMECGDPPRI